MLGKKINNKSETNNCNKSALKKFLSLKYRSKMLKKKMLFLYRFENEFFKSGTTLQSEQRKRADRSSGIQRDV